MKTKKTFIKNKKTRRSFDKRQNFEQDITIRFLVLLNTVKLYHWKTYSYSTHKATDKLYGSLNETIDKFMEVLLGKFANRVNLTKVKSMPVKDFTSLEQMKREINDFKSYLVGLNNNEALKSMSNSDLYNIRDEILGDLNQFLYLLSLH